MPSRRPGPPMRAPIRMIASIPDQARPFFEVEPGLRIFGRQTVVPDQRGAERGSGPPDPELTRAIVPGDHARAAGAEHAVAIHDGDRAGVVEVGHVRVVPIGVGRSRKKLGHAASELKGARMARISAERKGRGCPRASRLIGPVADREVSTARGCISSGRSAPRRDRPGRYCPSQAWKRPSSSSRLSAHQV